MPRAELAELQELVVPLAEQPVELGPVLRHPLAQRHELVVRHDEPYGRAADAEKREQAAEHACSVSPCRRGCAASAGRQLQIGTLRSGNALCQRLIFTVARSPLVQNGSSLKMSRTSASSLASMIQRPPSGLSLGTSRIEPGTSTRSFWSSRNAMCDLN